MVQQSKKLLELVHNQIQLRHYSHRTEESYIHWIKEYIYYFNKQHPAGMGKNEINGFYHTWRPKGMFLLQHKIRLLVPSFFYIVMC
jgi:ATP-dependent helicase YprA (DUF1998 family)